MALKQFEKSEGKKIVKTYRATKGQLKRLQELANQYTNGNVTAWLLYCALNYKPKKKELEK